MHPLVPASLYWPDNQRSLIMSMRGGTMPDVFVRRMRLVNVLSAVALQKLDEDLLAPFSVLDLHHILDKQISQDAVIDQLENKQLAEALLTGNLQPLYDFATA